jgi:hypothetical protein
VELDQVVSHALVKPHALRSVSLVRERWTSEHASRGMPSVHYLLLDARSQQN